MKTTFFLLNLALFLTSAKASEQSYTPGGYVVFEFPATVATDVRVISAPLLADRLYTGMVATFGTDSFTIANPSWSAGQFTQVPTFLYVTSGAETGRTVAVVANTNSQLTVDITDGGFEATNLNTPGFALAAGDTFAVMQSRTLGNVFGRTAGTVILTGGDHFDESDSVGLWDPASGEFGSYYFNTQVGHWLKRGAGKTQDFTNFVVPPGAAMTITRQAGRTATQLVLTGTVPTAAPLVKIAGSNNPRYLGTLLPVNTTLAQINLGPNWIKADDASQADKLSLYKSGDTKSKAFYENKDGQWLKVQHDDDKGNVVIPAGMAVLFRKRDGATGKDSFFPISLPYSL